MNVRLRSARGYIRTQSPHRNDGRFHPLSRHSGQLRAFGASNFKPRHSRIRHRPRSSPPGPRMGRLLSAFSGHNPFLCAIGSLRDRPVNFDIRPAIIRRAPGASISRRVAELATTWRGSVAVSRFDFLPNQRPTSAFQRITSALRPTADMGAGSSALRLMTDTVDKL